MRPVCALHAPNRKRRLAPARGAARMSAEVFADLRIDHAGETGSICIDREDLRCSRDETLLTFARRHRATEEAHLLRIESWLPPAHRSPLPLLERLAGSQAAVAVCRRI